MYEIRGIQRCHRLEQQAGVLERGLKLTPGEAQFMEDPGRPLGIVGPPAAGLIIYGAVTVAWFYIAGLGFDWWNETRETNARWLVAGYLGWLAVSLTFAWWKERHKKKSATD